MSKFPVFGSGPALPITAKSNRTGKHSRGILEGGLFLEECEGFQGRFEETLCVTVAISVYATVRLLGRWVDDFLEQC